MRERLEPVKTSVELQRSRGLLPDLTSVHLRRLERLEGGIDTPGHGDADRRPADAHLTALDSKARGADRRQEAWPQDESPLEPRRTPIVVGVDPDFVEVVDADAADLDAPGIAQSPRHRHLRRAQRRVGETRNRREHGRVRARQLPRLELVAEEEDQTGSAKTLHSKRSPREREDRVVDASIGQPDHPLDFVVAAADPEVPDRDSAGPQRRRLVVVESQRLGVRIDPRAEFPARQQRAGRSGMHDQEQERSEHQPQHQEKPAPVSSPPREPPLEMSRRGPRSGELNDSSDPLPGRWPRSPNSGAV